MNISELSPNQAWADAQANIIQDLNIHSIDTLNIAKATLDNHHIACPELDIIIGLSETPLKGRSKLLYANIEQLDKHLINYLNSIDHIPEGEVSEFMQKLNSIAATLEVFHSIHPKTKELTDEAYLTLDKEKEECLTMIEHLKAKGKKEISSQMSFNQLSETINKIPDGIENDGQAEIIIEYLRRYSV